MAPPRQGQRDVGRRWLTSATHSRRSPPGCSSCSCWSPTAHRSPPQSAPDGSPSVRGAGAATLRALRSLTALSCCSSRSPRPPPPRQVPDRRPLRRGRRAGGPRRHVPRHVLDRVRDRCPPPASAPGTIVLLAGGPGESAMVFTEDIGEAARAGPRGLRPRGRRSARHRPFGRRRVRGRRAPTSPTSAASSSATGARSSTTTETARDLDAVRAASAWSRSSRWASPTARRSRASTRVASRSTPRRSCWTRPVGVGPDRLPGLRRHRRRCRACCARRAPRAVRRDGARMPGPRCSEPSSACGRAAALTQVAMRSRQRRPDVDSDRWLLERAAAGRRRRGPAADLPAALASLARGDAAPFIHLCDRSDDRVRRAAPEARSEDDGEICFTDSRFCATACLESPAAVGDDVGAWLARRRPSGRFWPQLGRARSRRSARRRSGSSPRSTLCMHVAGRPPRPSRSRTPAQTCPVLVLAGRADLRTPLELAQPGRRDLPARDGARRAARRALRAHDRRERVRPARPRRVPRRRAPEPCTSAPPLAGGPLPAGERARVERGRRSRATPSRACCTTWPRPSCCSASARATSCSGPARRLERRPPRAREAARRLLVPRRARLRDRQPEGQGSRRRHRGSARPGSRSGCEEATRRPAVRQSWSPRAQLRSTIMSACAAAVGQVVWAA